MFKHRTKIMLLLGIFIMGMFFMSDFSLIDIQKTALIIAIGIDRVDDQFEVTAQIAVPQATDQTANNNDTNISAKGTTVLEAIDKMGAHTGWYPKLSFCDLIIFGNSTVEEGLSPILKYLAASKRFQNSSLIACAEGTAKEVLLSSTPLDAIASFAIQKILLKNTLKVSNICHNDIRSYGLMTYSPSKVSFMPIIKIVPNDDKANEGGSSSQMASASEGGGSSSSGGGSEKSYVFDATNTAVFSDGIKVCELNTQESLLFNLLNKRVEESYFGVESEDGGETLLSITRNKNKISVSFGEKPTLNVFLSLSVTTVDNNEVANYDKLQNQSLLSKDLIDAAEKKLEGIFSEMVIKLGKANADLFEAKNYVYKFNYPKYESFKDTKLTDFNFTSEVIVQSVD